MDEVLYGLIVYVLSKIHKRNPNPQEDGALGGSLEAIRSLRWSS